MKLFLDNDLHLTAEALMLLEGGAEINGIDHKKVETITLTVSGRRYQIKVPESGILTWDEVQRQMSKIDQLQGGSAERGDSALDERIEKP